MNNILRIISILFVIIFIYLMVSNFFLAIKLPPSGGDSYWYHVPIAKNILNGNIFFQKNIVEIEQWYPGATEILLSFFILLKLPVNLFNVVGIAVFSLVLYKFGESFLKDRYISMIYAMSIVVSYGVFRLVFSQNIDIWMAIYFLMLIMLFEKPQKTIRYFFFTGLFSGMLIGSKYTGFIYFFVLFIVYFKSVAKNLDLKRLLIFLIPVSFIGLSWYIRNFILTGSPVYPQSILFLKGLAGWKSYLTVPIWEAIIKTPKFVIDAFISEFMLWPGLFTIIPGVLIYLKIQKKMHKLSPKLRNILIISSLLLLVYLFLPYDNLYLGVILSVRYIYNVFALLALSVFLIAKYFKLEKILSIGLFLASLVIFYQPYHPKIVFIYVPLITAFSLLILYRKQILKIVKNYL